MCWGWTSLHPSIFLDAHSKTDINDSYSDAIVIRFHFKVVTLWPVSNQIELIRGYCDNTIDEVI